MKKILLYFVLLTIVSCEKDLLNRQPLDRPSSETFWTSAENAKLWINGLYGALPGFRDAFIEGWSDNAWIRAGNSGGVIADGSFQPTSEVVERRWDYTYIRRSLEFLEKIDQVPEISQEQKDKLVGQAKFILSFEYHELISLYGDVPLVKKPLTISESDIPKSTKSEVLKYILTNLNDAINKLPEAWDQNEKGRATKAAALALKARICLYNEMWSEAAKAAKAVMDLNIYQLDPNFSHLFLKAYNNKSKEVILARQYAENVNENDVYHQFGILGDGGWALILPLPSLVNSFECKDGLPISESPLYDPNHPFKNRDPRFYETFIYPYQTINGYYYDPLDAKNRSYSLTYVHYRKYIGDMQPGEVGSFVNWNIFRYAGVLLMYAEAKNEESGPDASVYHALDLIRMRADMPVVDRNKYSTQETLRAFIRNERRVELAGEGLRYFDIIRWKIADSVLNRTIKSTEAPNLPVKIIETRVFKAPKDYIWPIPQSAIDAASNLEQNPLWE